MNIPFLTNQVLFVAITAVSSTARSHTNTMYDLIKHVRYQAALREEIRKALIASGRSLPALQKMHRLDSFIKEPQRLSHHLLCKSVRTLRLSAVEIAFDHSHKYRSIARYRRESRCPKGSLYPRAVSSRHQHMKWLTIRILSKVTRSPKEFRACIYFILETGLLGQHRQIRGKLRAILHSSLTQVAWGGARN